MEKFNRNHQNNQQKEKNRLPEGYPDISFDYVQK